MGTFEVGILGGFNGKVGTVVGSRWKGIDTMRHKGRKSKKAPTTPQLEHRAKFALITKFVNKLADVLMKWYPATPELTGINNAFSDIYDNAVTGAYPAFALDYSKVLVSKGELYNGVNPAITAVAGGTVKFDWTDNSGAGKAKADDRSLLVVYCPELGQFIFTDAGPARSTGTASLNVIHFTGKVVETWLSFISAAGDLVATSIYTGQVTVV